MQHPAAGVVSAVANVGSSSPLSAAANNPNTPIISFPFDREFKERPRVGSFPLDEQRPTSANICLALAPPCWPLIGRRRLQRRAERPLGSESRLVLLTAPADFPTGLLAGWWSLRSVRTRPSHRWVGLPPRMLLFRLPPTKAKAQSSAPPPLAASCAPGNSHPAVNPVGKHASAAVATRAFLSALYVQLISPVWSLKCQLTPRKKQPAKVWRWPAAAGWKGTFKMELYRLRLLAWHF